MLRRAEEKKRKDGVSKNEKKKTDTALHHVRCNTATDEAADKKKIWRKNNLMTTQHASSPFPYICMLVLVPVWL